MTSARFSVPSLGGFTMDLHMGNHFINAITESNDNRLLSDHGRGVIPQPYVGNHQEVVKCGKAFKGFKLTLWIVLCIVQRNNGIGICKQP